MTFRWFTVTAALAGFCSPLAAAEDLPAIKAGLWETRFVSGGLVDGAPPTKQCMGDKIGLDAVVRATGGACEVKWKRMASDRYESETNCKMGPISAKGKGTITGDFSSKLKIETITTVSMENAPAGVSPAALSKGPRTMVMEMSWVGPCAPGQNPGDTIMPDGKVMRMPAMPR
jgi:hypothetical protein